MVLQEVSKHYLAQATSLSVRSSPGVSSTERERVKALEREVRELRPARFAAGRSSTADSSPERFHRPASGHLRGRADLQVAADHLRLAIETMPGDMIIHIAGFPAASAALLPGCHLPGKDKVPAPSASVGYWQWE